MIAIGSRYLMMFWALIFAGAALSQSSQEAAQQSKSAQEVVTDVTDDMVKTINSSKALLATNPQEYYSKVASILEPVVAFDYIAKIVMSNYYEKASEQQRDEFAEVFKTSMVQTFAKGLANYSDFDISVKAPEKDQTNERKVEVLQEVKSSDGTHIISYTMAQNKTGEWKLINVVLNGVNLGKSFRDQFAQAMRQHSEDLPLVIKTWGKQDA
jgi:phospholipid transport system substrate-binding protein